MNSLEEDTDPREGTVKNENLHLSVRSKHQMRNLPDVPKLRDISKRISRHKPLRQQ